MCQRPYRGAIVSLFSLSVLLIGCGVERAWYAVVGDPAPEPIGAEGPVEITLPTPWRGPGDDLSRPVVLDDPSGEALLPLYRAFDAAARGEDVARMLFYGGSHTFADHYTGWLREMMQARFGDSGHGFVFPVAPVTDYWQRGARVIDLGSDFAIMRPSKKSVGERPYGLPGVSVRAERPSRVAVESGQWASGTRFSRIEIMLVREPGAGRVRVLVDGREVGVHPLDAVRVSPMLVTHVVPDGEHRVDLLTEGGPVEVLGVALERDRAGALVENVGFVGMKARHLLLANDAIWTAFHRARRPHLYALAFGNNEELDENMTPEDHEVHLRAVLARFKEATPSAACLLIGPTDRVEKRGGKYVPKLRTEPIHEMQRRVARDVGCAFFDTLQFMGGTGVLDDWLAADPAWARDDFSHFTEHGYKRWGQRLHDAIMEGYVRYREEKAKKR